ncbi:MAG: tRNA (adenosine(37)-N6)-dimethylallyltransferase MiaA [Truepera sp.]|nr:tRNA (adenosine(37)-N6)-dimethylallyltransferase MiaA [Truepera sp.]
MESILVLAGPTASGKSELALALADLIPTEIISADAMLVYQGMDIGTAKPKALERQRVPHHLIDVVTPAEPFSVADYVRLAEAAIAEVQARGRLPLVVGGTGFYIRALTEGLPTVPPADGAVQAELWRVFEAEGLEPLLDELRRASPLDEARAQRNPRRIVRALEILRRTGRPPSSFPPRAPRFSYRKCVLLPSVATLQARITARTAQMFAAGLITEVYELLRRYPEQPTALQAIGYKEVVEFLRGRGTLEQVQERVTQATVQYAKRQRTWFRREPGVVLIEADGYRRPS